MYIIYTLYCPTPTKGFSANVYICVNHISGGKKDFYSFNSTKVEHLLTVMGSLSFYFCPCFPSGQSFFLIDMKNSFYVIWILQMASFVFCVIRCYFLQLNHKCLCSNLPQECAKIFKEFPYFASSGCL